MRPAALVCLLFFVSNIFSQETQETQELQQIPQITDNQFYEISPIYNFKQGILSLTFDDGTINQFTLAVPLLNARNIPATFYVIGYELDDSISSRLFINAHSNLHEIGSHTMHHLNLAGLNKDKVEKELSKSQKGINTLLKSRACLTLAFPFGTFNDTVIEIAKKYYLATRSGILGYNAIDTFDRWRLKSKIYTQEATLGGLNSLGDYACRYGLWAIEVFHGVNGQGFEPINLVKLERHLDHIKVNKNVWVATVSNVVKYHDEYKSTTLICEECNDTVYKIRISNNLNDSIYDQPLSIKLRISNNWDSVQIVGGEILKTDFSNNSQHVFFNTNPQNKLVIRPKIIYSVDKNPLFFVYGISPNPLMDYINIDLKVLHQTDIHFTLLNSRGYPIAQYANEFYEGRQSQHLDMPKCEKGIYFLKMDSETRKLKQVSLYKLVKL